MKKLLVDIRPSIRYSIYSFELTPTFIDELFKQTRFRFSEDIDSDDIMDIVMMAYTYRMVENIEELGINISVALSPSIHPNYRGWLMMIELEDSTLNIMPHVANYFTWDREETQNVMTIHELFSL